MSILKGPQPDTYIHPEAVRKMQPGDAWLNEDGSFNDEIHTEHIEAYNHGADNFKRPVPEGKPRKFRGNGRYVQHPDGTARDRYLASGALIPFRDWCRDNIPQETP